MEQNRQLRLGEEIPAGRDSEGNVWAIDQSVVTLKLAKEKYTRKLGILNKDRFIVYRDKKKHLFHKTNSYGFNYEVIIEIQKTKGIKYVDVYDDEGLFRISIEDMKLEGKFLFFKEEGFEKQLFVPVDCLYKRSILLPEDEKRKELLGESWFNKLKAEFHKEYWAKLGVYVAQRRQIIDVYPEVEDVFKAYKTTPYDKVKVVILGLDPYFNPGIADGLAFSSKEKLQVPVSLQKIHEAIEKDVHEGLYLDNSPSLMYLAKQGVLLINTILTVEYKQPGSHTSIGWERFTDRVIDVLKEHDKDLVIMLWGAKAKEYKSKIENGRHLVLEAEHPAYAARESRDWRYGECFKKANMFLLAKGYGTINW